MTGRTGPATIHKSCGGEVLFHEEDGAYCLECHANRLAEGEYVRTAPAVPVTPPNAVRWGLVVDVFDVLERAGYHRGDDQHVGRAIGMLYDLVAVYQGREVTP